MNETELRRRLSELGAKPTLNQEKNGIQFPEKPVIELPAELRKVIEDLQDQMVRRELHLTAWTFVADSLKKHGGPGLHPAAMAAFGAEGRNERLSHAWATASLEDFKATLRDCIDAALDASYEPTAHYAGSDQPPDTTSETEQQLPFA